MKSGSLAFKFLSIAEKSEVVLKIEERAKQANKKRNFPLKQNLGREITSLHTVVETNQFRVQF